MRMRLSGLSSYSKKISKNVRRSRRKSKLVGTLLSGRSKVYNKMLISGSTSRTRDKS